MPCQGSWASSAQQACVTPSEGGGPHCTQWGGDPAPGREGLTNFHNIMKKSVKSCTMAPSQYFCSRARDKQSEPKGTYFL